jgi:hypothetical protein
MCIRPNKRHGREQDLQDDVPKKESDANATLVA